MPRAATLLSLLLTIASVAWAQDERSATNENQGVVEVSLQSDLLGTDLIDTRDVDLGGGRRADANLVFIDQTGEGNSAEVEQRRAEANRVRIRQRGGDNEAAVLQQGANNEVALLQNGYNNRYSLDLEGSDNDIAVSQRGAGNTVRQDLQDARDLSIDILQDGDNNLIEHRTDGLTSKGIKIIQRADNLQLQITQTATAGPPGN